MPAGPPYDDGFGGEFQGKEASEQHIRELCGGLVSGECPPSRPTLPGPRCLQPHPPQIRSHPHPWPHPHSIPTPSLTPTPPSSPPSSPPSITFQLSPLLCLWGLHWVGAFPSAFLRAVICSSAFLMDSILTPFLTDLKQLQPFAVNEQVFFEGQYVHTSRNTLLMNTHLIFVFQKSKSRSWPLT